jgi:hypothetical protein
MNGLGTSRRPGVQIAGVELVVLDAQVPRAAAVGGWLRAMWSRGG